MNNHIYFKYISCCYSTNYPCSIKNSLWFFIFLFSISANIIAQDAASIQLIIRVDDMGASHATNTGIRQTYLEGIATSVEIMAPTPWFPEAVQMLKKIPEFDVGVHLVLTSEWANVKWRPLTGPSSITDSWGFFYPMIWPNKNFPEGAALIENDWKIEDIEKELRAQIELTKRELPHLSHMSGHMGCLNINEETKALFRKLGEEYGLDIFLEDHKIKRFPYDGNNLMPPKQRIEKFIEAIEALTPGNWMYVEHPAHDLPEQQAIGHLGYEHVSFDRGSVTALLINEEVKAALKKKGVRLISYLDLKK